MEARTGTVGAEGSRLPPPVITDVPKATFLLLGSWTTLLEGALLLVMLPVLVLSTRVDIPPRDITQFAAAGVLCVIGGAVVYLPRRWGWWVALAAPIVAGAYIGWLDDISSTGESYVAVGLSALAVVLLLIGRPAAGNSEAIALAGARIPFRAKVTGTWVAIFFLLGVFLALSDLDFGFIAENFWYIAKGLEYTILLSIFAILLATVLALLGALGRLSHNAIAYGVSGFYTSFFRGTPLIVQLFLIYLALPQIGNNLHRPNVVPILALTVFVAGCIGLGLNYGAYMTEIFRAGIQSVGHGQGEAADALAMTYRQKMRRVVLPQAIRVIIPPTGNEFIAMMKDTALVGVLGGEVVRAELFQRATLAFSADLTKRLETLLLAAAFYWMLTSIFTFFQARLERRISKGYVRTEVRTATGRKRPQFIPAPLGAIGVSGTGMVEVDDDESGLP
jgi:polar amino acid transport system permease protein